MGKGKKKFVVETPKGSAYTQASSGGKVTAKLEWSQNFAQSMERGFENAQAFVDSECIRRMNPETPRRTGALIKSATLGTTIGSGEINQITPYARRQYYEHKENGNYGSWQSMSASTYGDDYNANITVSGLNYRKAYTVQVKAEDRITFEETKPVTVRSIPMFYWNQNAFHFNVPVTAPSIEMNGLADYIVEQGSNANGNYRKWNSGIMEMWGVKKITGINVDKHDSTNVSYWSAQQEVVFPVASLTQANIVATNASASGAYVTMSTGGDWLRNFFFWLYYDTQIYDSTHYVSWRATGTWK